VVREGEPAGLADIQQALLPLAVAKGWSAPSQDWPMTVSGMEKGHGRIEERIVTSSSILADYHEWFALSDVTLHEDASQLRRGDGPQVLTALNTAAIGIVLQSGEPTLLMPNAPLIFPSTAFLAVCRAKRRAPPTLHMPDARAHCGSIPSA
jgi:hypothetical protein